MTKTGPAAEHASARAFNDYHPLGTPVRYWKGIREGDGKVARTRTEAQLLGGHTAVVWLEGVSGCIALTHIQPISEEELAAADRIPAPRPVPTFADRTAALEELRAERVKTGRLEGDLRSQTQAVREALAERDEAREQLVAGVKARTTVLTDEIGRWKVKLTEARADRDDARRERDEAARICGEAGIEIDRLRAEQDRLTTALVRARRLLIAANIIQPEQEIPASAAALGSPRRAQEDRARGYDDAIAALRDDSRYMDWWSSTGVKPAGTVRQVLAAYLETVGPDGPDVTKPSQARP